MEVRTHPKYVNYEISSNGQFRLKESKVWRSGMVNEDGYSMFSAGKSRMLLKDTVWETFKGAIHKGKEIRQINGIKTDNRIENLIQRRKKEVVYNAYEILNDIGKQAHKKRRHIQSFDTVTGESKVFKSKNQTANFFGCSPALVYLICEKKKGCTLFDQRYDFLYTTDEVTDVIPDPRIGQKLKPRKKKEVSKTTVEI